MRWTRRGRSAHLEDRRGQSGRRMVRGGGIGCSALLFLVALSVIFETDFLSLLGPALVTEDPSEVPGEAGDFVTTPEEEELVDFMSFVLDDLQATWAEVLPATGVEYRNTRMVLFRDAIRSGCGLAGSATGPFYCPGDEEVYLDLGFFATSSTGGSELRETLPRLTSSPTKWVTMFRVSSASSTRCAGSRAA